MDFPNPKRPTLAEMLGIPANPSSEPPPAPRRRLSLQEMLRQSPLMGNTVSLPQAVESAQASAARKAAGEPEPQPAVPEAAVAIPEVVAPVADSPDVTATHFPIATPVVLSDSTIPIPTTGPSRYNLYARVNGRWVWQCDIRAANHAEAMRSAIACLAPQHDSLPIRLEQDEIAPAA